MAMHVLVFVLISAAVAADVLKWRANVNKTVCQRMHKKSKGIPAVWLNHREHEPDQRTMAFRYALMKHLMR